MKFFYCGIRVQPYLRLPTVEPIRLPRNSATLLIEGCPISTPNGLSSNTMSIFSFAPWIAGVGLLARGELDTIADQRSACW